MLITPRVVGGADDAAKVTAELRAKMAGVSAAIEAADTRGIGQ